MLTWTPGTEDCRTSEGKPLVGSIGSLLTDRKEEQQHRR